MYEKEINVAQGAIYEAGQLLKAQQGRVSKKNNKGSHKNYATEQDITAERILMDAINSSFSADKIMSEETYNDEDYSDDKRVWIIDPIDGTRNYAHGFDYYCVLVSLMIDQEIELSFVYQPNLDRLYFAQKGQGFFLNDKQIRMKSPDNTIEDSLLITGFAYFTGDELDKPLKNYKKLLSKSVDVLRLGSCGLDIVQVALGKAGALYEVGVKPWDIASGILMVQEVGGIVTDYEGNNIDLLKPRKNANSMSIIAAKNKQIHSEILNTINAT